MGAGDSNLDLPQVRDAAVLVGLFRSPAGERCVLLIRRGAGVRHGGQIGFPGGVCEPSDASPADAAIREACEEVGLTRDAIEMIGGLPVHVTISSGFRILPFLARIRTPQAWQAHPVEVDEVIEARVSELADPHMHEEGSFHEPEWPGPRTFPFIRIAGHRLWGATYRILMPLLARISAGEFDPL